MSTWEEDRRYVLESLADNRREHAVIDDKLTILLQRTATMKTRLMMGGGVVAALATGLLALLK